MLAHRAHLQDGQIRVAAALCAANREYRPYHGHGQVSDVPHRVAKLHQLAWRSRKWEAYQAAFRKLTSTVDGIERQATPWPDWAVTTEIDTAPFWPRVWEAVCRHQTQMSIYERLQDLTAEQQIALWGSQEFYRVLSSVNGGRTLETDLFQGLR